VPVCNIDELSPQRVIAEERPDKVRVTLTDGSQVELADPVVVGDTLRGLEMRAEWVNGLTRRESSEQWSRPLADVSGLELRKTDALLTTALITGIAVAVAGVTAAVVYSSLDMSWGMSP
jgi:hypothetical protein